MSCGLYHAMQVHRTLNAMATRGILRQLSLSRVRARWLTGPLAAHAPPHAITAENGSADPAPRSGPLSDVTVVDLTRVLAGPYCTLMLRELGARVIKVESPKLGDDSRAFGPWLSNGESAYFETLNSGKESCALNLKCEDDLDVFFGLLARADVLVENFRPGVLERLLGCAWEELSRRYPRLSLASISGFGQTGPHRLQTAYDCSMQALGGIMSVTGPVGGIEPIRVGISLGDLAAGMYGALNSDW